MRAYFEAQSRWDADALPGIVSDDFTLGPFKSVAALQEAWCEPYDRLEEETVVESVELEESKPVVRWRSELRWRHDGSLAATQTVVTRHTVVRPHDDDAPPGALRLGARMTRQLQRGVRPRCGQMPCKRCQTPMFREEVVTVL